MEFPSRFTTMGGPRPGYVQFSRLSPPQLLGSPTVAMQAESLDISSLPNIDDTSVIIHSPTKSTVFWASSARPLTDRSDFAVATSAGTMLFVQNQFGWSLGPRMPFSRQRSMGEKAVDVLDVDWLNENVVMSGCRDGSVRLWDVRSKSLASGTSIPFVHPSAINYVRRINSNRIVVAGIENRMCVYDLRFLQKAEEGKKRATRPFATFPGYRNRDQNALAVGLDVLGDALIAVGTDDEMVQVFDVGTGGELEIGIGGKLGNRKLGGLARTLKFLDGEGSQQGPKLLVSAGSMIEEWVW